MSTTIDNKIKEMKGRRLFRTLRRRFKVRDFMFEWCTDETAYWDGKTMFIKYNISNDNRQFTDEQEDVIREGFAYHEMGHKVYDNMEVYREWIQQNSSEEKPEWHANEMWPLVFVSDMANIAADGRLEHALVVDYPFTKPYIDYLNNCLVEGPPENRGNDKIKDFKNLLLRRSLGLKEIEGFHEEVLELIDNNQHLIDAYIHTYSTKDCLHAMRNFIKEVWPTYLDWLGDEEPTSHSDLKSPHSDTNWGSDESKDANNQRAKEASEAIQSNEEFANSEPSSIELILQNRVEENERIKRESEVELAEALANPINNSLHVSRTTTIKGDIVSTVFVEVPTESNRANFDGMEDDNKLAISGLAKALKLTLEPAQAVVINNSRSGRFRANMAWKGLKCGNPKMYRHEINGVPKGDAYLACMADISGSTSMLTKNNVPAVREIAEALTVINSAAHKVNLPSKAFAFTTLLSKTKIFQLKPNEHKFTAQNKGAIGGLTHMQANRDVAALQFLLDDLETRNETIRIGIFISDGSPCFFQDESEDTIKEMVKKASKKNIDIICLFVGNDEEGFDCAKRMYGNRVILSRTSLANDFKKQLINILAMRRG